MKHTITYSAVVALSLSLCLLSLCLLGLSGCGAPADSEPATETNTTDGSGAKDADAATDTPAEDGLSDMEKMKATLAKLLPEDAASAEKQHFCPVSGAMLGAMGAPIKLDVDGQQVWICCEGCRDPLLENPQQYLAKLKSQ